MPAHVAMHCAAADPLIGHPEFPVTGSGVEGPAQSTQVTIN
jgi:hypothetical protein